MDIITAKIKLPKAISPKVKACVIYAVSVVIAFVAIGNITCNIVANEMKRELEADLLSKAKIIAGSISKETAYPEDTLLSASLAGTGTRGIIIDNGGGVVCDTNIASSDVGTILTDGIITKALSGEEAFETIEEKSGKILTSVSVPFEAESMSGVIFLSRESSDVDIVKGKIRTTMFYLCLFCTLVMVVLAFLVTKVISLPLNEFVNCAREISKGNFKMRVSTKKNQEINELAEAMNYMCAELEHLDVKRREFVSDASHELKTPLATIKLICDSITSTDTPDIEMVKDFLSDLSEEVDRLSRIIEKLLILSKLDSQEAQASLELVDFGMMLQRIKTKLTPLALSKNMTITVDTPENLQPIMLDYDRITESVYNIIDNAIKYSKIGSNIRVNVAEDETALTLRVYDSGKGIPDEYKEKIFDRFYRLDDSRARDTGGTGLGLSIAREAVLLHNGKLYVEDNADGGSCFVMVLPIGNEDNNV